MKSRQYQAQSGETRFKAGVMVSQIQFLGESNGITGSVQDDLAPLYWIIEETSQTRVIKR